MDVASWCTTGFDMVMFSETVRSPKLNSENTFQYKVPSKTWGKSLQKPLSSTRKWLFGISPNAIKSGHWKWPDFDVGDIAVTTVINIPASGGRKEFFYQINPPSTHI